MPRGVSETEQFNLWLPRNRGEKQTSPAPAATTTAVQPPVPGVLSGSQEGRGAQASAVSSSLAPHRTLHLSLLSGAQGLRKHWGEEGAEGSSIMDDQRAAVKSRPRGEDGEAEGEKLALQREEPGSCVPTKLSLYQCGGEGRGEGMMVPASKGWDKTTDPISRL